MDPKNEKKFGISLPEVIKRAARNKERGGLFKGKSFWWAKGVVGQPEVIRVLVQAAGGSVSVFRFSDPYRWISADTDFGWLDTVHGGDPEDERAA